MIKLLLLIVILTFTGCNKIEPELENHSNENVIDINGAQKTFRYQVGNDKMQKDDVHFEISADDEIVITFSEGVTIHQWMPGENTVGAKLKSQRTYADNTKRENEGMSSNLQEFAFEITDRNTFESITFYKVNKDDSLKLPPVFELIVNFTLKEENEEDAWGIQMSAIDVTSDGLTLQIKQSGGNAQGDLQTGDWYSLEQKVKDEWITVEPVQKDVAYHEIAYIIRKNDVTNLKEDWNFLYGTLPVGEYRIGKEITDFRETGKYVTEIYYAYFEIRD